MSVCLFCGFVWVPLFNQQSLYPFLSLFLSPWLILHLPYSAFDFIWLLSLTSLNPSPLDEWHFRPRIQVFHQESQSAWWSHVTSMAPRIAWHLASSSQPGPPPTDRHDLFSCFPKLSSFGKEKGGREGRHLDSWEHTEAESNWQIKKHKEKAYLSKLYWDAQNGKQMFWLPLHVWDFIKKQILQRLFPSFLH